MPGEGVYRNKTKEKDEENVVFSSRDSAPWVEADTIAASEGHVHYAKDGVYREKILEASDE